jgi:3'-phosphoadenosine 5'-phosphosulfate sulfotransferase (PAPS reductase)/FAD synthetase
VKVRLTNYDWIVGSTSAGKDSSCMLDVLVEGCLAQGVPLSRLVAAHADLGKVEWPGTKELAQRQAARYGLRFEVVRRKAGDLLQMVRQRRRALDAQGRFDTPAWFSPQTRNCTSDAKRGPIATLFTKLAGETRRLVRGRRVRLLNCMGMRAQESGKRAKLLPFRLNTAQTNGRRIVHDYLPLHGWTEEEVWARIREKGIEVHPAYGLGMGRLSCCF